MSSQNISSLMRKNIYNLILLCAAAPSISLAQGALENPASGSTESGIGIISGWHCTASKIDIFVDGTLAGSTYTGSSRADTSTVCNGNSSTGYSYLINFNSLSRGEHNIKVFADGIQFGERTFNTTQSGGQEFLSGATKQVTVPDFPSAGANTTLTWSESKQSFVVTGTQSGTSSPQATGLSKLYGDVTFRYKFTSSPNIYTDSASLSSANLESDGYLRKAVRNGSATLQCGVLETGPEFLCMIINHSSRAMDIFRFDVSSTGAISGTYEYCLGGTSGSTCALDLIVSPDGTVSGTVIRTTSAKTLQLQNNQQKADEKNKQLNIELDSSVTSGSTEKEVDSINRNLDSLTNLIHK